MTQTRDLAAYAAGLRYDDLPDGVRDMARACIQDTVGISVFGANLPWGKFAIDYARRNAAAGHSALLGVPGVKISAPFAALANGVLTHAFEMDSLRKPGTGVHPGGIVPAALAVAQQEGVSGRDLITAFVAGMEVMTRIGLSTRHSSEEKGFHAPGLTGVFGATVAAGSLLKLDADQMCNAMGVAGSLCSGLLEFAKSGSGGMVKRLHIGRAAEGGVLAASLAKDGYEGPASILEGKFGFLNAYTNDPLMEKLTGRLGDTWETRTICFKRCACHATAHTPVQAFEELRAEVGFTAADVDRISIGSSRKVLANHNNPEPQDLMAAQYSVPFSVALSFFHDPMDPTSFLDADLSDPAILGLSRKITLEHFDETTKPGQAWACRARVTLRDGREAERTLDDFRGSPTQPMSEDEFDGKFRAATRALGEPASGGMLARLKALDECTNVRELAP